MAPSRRGTSVSSARAPGASRRLSELPARNSSSICAADIGCENPRLASAAANGLGIGTAQPGLGDAVDASHLGSWPRRAARR
jgi:hypothetical protein